jgi:hypothetical protein
MSRSTVPSPATALQNGYSVRVLDTAPEMEGVRPFWESQNWNPNAQMDFYGLINEVRGNVLKPYVMVLEHDGEPSALMVGRIVRQDFSCQFGYKTVRLGQVRALRIAYGGVLGCDGQACAEAVLNELCRMLGRREVDLVTFSHLNTGSDLFQLVSRRPGVSCRDHLVAPQLHWKTKLPATPVEFVQRLNKKHRYWLRRLEKQLEKDFPGRVSFRSFASGQQLGELLNDMETIAGKTYQRGLGAGFRNDAEHARRFEFEARKNWLRAYVLYLDNRPSAFWAGTLYKSVFYSAYTGYDPGFRKYELGTLVFVNMVEQLCAERVEAIDYGLGDALYKQRFGDQSWQEASVRIFAPSFRAMALNVVQTSLEMPALWLKSLLERAHLQQRIKTLWRRRLTRPND